MSEGVLLDTKVELVPLSKPATLAGAPHFATAEEAVSLETQSSAW